MNKALYSGGDSLARGFLVAGGLVVASICSGFIASSIYVNADNTDIVDNVNVTIPISCTMGGVIATGQEHSASINPNTYQANIGKTTITTTCNDASGYAIYAIGYTGDVYTGANHTKLIGTNTGTTISTGLYTVGTTTDSVWSMKVNKVTDSTISYQPNYLTINNDFDDYHTVPDTYTKVATYTAPTDVGNNALGSKIETTYAAYINGSQAADTYTGKVKYTLVHPNTAVPTQPQTTQTGKIRYYANVSDYEGTMADQDIAASVTLLSSNFSRTGYGFAGWSDKFDYATNPEAKFYGPMETITLNTADYTGTNPGLSLYAIWVKSQGNLQDSAKVATVCSSLTQAPIDGTANLSSVSALTDQRDNNTYAIAKLADGKCWMIENLRLADKDSSNNDIELSTTNTNSPSLPLTNIYDATNPTTSNHFSVSTNPTSTAWCTTNSAACDDQSMLYTGNTTERGTNPATSTNTYSYGNYYNWYSATAGHGKYSTRTNNSATAGDICPTGWTLPESGDKTNMTAEKNDFYKLGLSLGLSAPANYEGQTRPYWTGTLEGSTASSTYRSYPNNFLYSGYVSGSSVNHRGRSGYYWSKSAYSGYYAYYLNFHSSNVDPSNNYNKYFGFSVRCLAQ